MIYRLRTKLSLSYVLIVLISVFLISFITNELLNQQFTKYVKLNQEQKNKEVVSSIGQLYQDNGSWNMDMIESVGMSALENGLIIKFVNKSNVVLWDAKTHNNGMCQRIIEHMAQNMSSRFPSVKGNYIEKPYPVKVKTSQVGTVFVGSYGPVYLSDNDLAFINTLNSILFGVGALSLMFAMIFGFFMASRLSSPIARVIQATQSISKGHFKDRVMEKSTTAEICQLTSAVNELAETLMKQETLRKRLTADVAHELRTPLATLQSHLEAMIDGIWKPESERLKSCHEEIVRIGGLVGDLEKLTKYENENLILQKSQFNVTELIQHIIKNFENELRQKDMEINLFGETEFIFADRDKLSQVIINLLSNALKYASQGGMVEITVKGEVDITQIMFKDNGDGISQDDLPYIFDRFYRADQSRTRITGGAGIGLAIAKAIVEAHLGKIEVHSEVNVGTAFILSLPKSHSN